MIAEMTQVAMKVVFAARDILYRRPDEMFVLVAEGSSYARSSRMEGPVLGMDRVNLDSNSFDT